MKFDNEETGRNSYDYVGVPVFVCKYLMNRYLRVGF